MSETNNKSLGFSSFRTLMDLWDNYVFEENVANEIDKVLNNKKILFFFNFKDKDGIKLFGTDDSNRMVYAMWKNPSKNDPSPAIESFQAFDLHALLKNKENQEGEKIRLFNKKDLNKITVITDRDEVLEKLSKNVADKDFEVEKNPIDKSIKVLKDKKNERK